MAALLVAAVFGTSMGCSSPCEKFIEFCADYSGYVCPIGEQKDCLTSCRNPKEIAEVKKWAQKIANKEVIKIEKEIWERQCSDRLRLTENSIEYAKELKERLDDMTGKNY